MLPNIRVRSWRIVSRGSGEIAIRLERCAILLSRSFVLRGSLNRLVEMHLLPRTLDGRDRRMQGPIRWPVWYVLHRTPLRDPLSTPSWLISSVMLTVGLVLWRFDH